jgi:hypothetical protein
MVLTKSELIEALQTEVRILVHLASKADAAALDYRPTPKQRSTMELLKYLTMMGPVLAQAAKTGVFDLDNWTASEQAAAARTSEETIAALADQGDTYASLLGDMSDADFRAEVAPFGEKTTRGAFLVRWVLCGCAAYRTQIFLYLKSCGRDELGTSNLWNGVDAPPG